MDCITNRSDISIQKPTNFRKDLEDAGSSSSHFMEATVTPPIQMNAKCDEVKVTARWWLEEACRPIIDEAPAFYPSEEEFKDTLGYIARIRHEAPLGSLHAH
ncbi:uncharacterized protein A4U43_C03F5890 [Asparagus officinalis]|uniref:JmjN domain-containing protein n=1 Tax=Asparagus officinalis TaxID=4686 RepID=A0A5P1F7Q5_ASPOF|nr:uncharacterized protein A4U43_C03F5890 [Asparagus officinalis]